MSPAVPLLKKFVLLLVMLLLLLVAAWLASNWNDARPQPRPAALQLPSPPLPDERNAYFALVGLHAAADREPSSAGKALWGLQLARATAIRRTSFNAATGQPDSAIEAVLGQALPSIPACDTNTADCVARWIDTPDALTGQRHAHAVLGQRCERLHDGAFAFDELLAPMRTVAEPMAQHGIGAANCSRWFLDSAVLAWVQHDAARAIALLLRADRMNRALLGGSHSLIGQMIAVRNTRNTRNTFDVMSALAVRDAALASALAPLLAPLPDQVASIKRWMVVEAAFSRGMILEIEQHRISAVAAAADEPLFDEFELFGWLARHRIGWHPERTAQASDANWMRSIQQLDGGLAAALRARESEAAHDGIFTALTWINPIGNVLINLGAPGYGLYMARQFDLDLHLETAALAIRAASEGVEPAQRRAWLARQALSAPARERVAFSDDGLVLGARTWQETSVAGVQPSPRDAIRITWPTPK